MNKHKFLFYKVKHYFLLVVLFGSFFTFLILFVNFSSIESFYPYEAEIRSLKNLIPDESFDFYWSIDKRNSSETLQRYFLVLQSIFIHQPNATIILFSSHFNLNEDPLILSFRQRGYRIYSFEFFDLFHLTNISNSTIDFDEMKWKFLSIYGGTYFHFDQIFLRNLPREEFSSKNFQLIRSKGKENLRSIDLKIVDFHRCSTFDVSNSSLIFHQVERDTMLKFVDLSKRCEVFRIFFDENFPLNFKRNSLIDFIFRRFDLGFDEFSLIRNRSNFLFTSFVHRSTIIFLHQRSNSFENENFLYFRLNETMNRRNSRWNLTLTLINGTLKYLRQNSMTNLNQRQINEIFAQMIYQPKENSSIDRLTIELKSTNFSLKTSIQISIFSRLVSFISKTMGLRESQWKRVKHLISSVEQFYPQTSIYIASDSGKHVQRNSIDQFIRSNRNLSQVFLYFLPEDSGLSYSRNFLLDQIQTDFIFHLDDDFVLENDSHLDLLLQMLIENPSIDLIAGKIPEDILTYQDYSGIFLRQNRTLELTHQNRSINQNHRVFRDQIKINDENNSLISSCVEVDFVPNVFLSRRESLKKIRWRNDLKVGEHEDFFFRFRQSNRTVFTCRFINVHHHQYYWWINRTDPYFHQRNRVHHYLRRMLFDHRFDRLIAFNYLHVDFTRFPFNRSELLNK